MKNINAFVSVALLSILVSFGPLEPDEIGKNKIDCSGYIYSNLGDRDFYSGEKCIWLEDHTILTSYDLQKISLNNNFYPVSIARQWHDSVMNGNKRRTPWYTNLSSKRDRLICLLKGDPAESDWKYFNIFEYDLKTGVTTQITDSVKDIRAVQYLTDTTLVYYQVDIPYNEGQGGYYLYNMNTKRSELLLRQGCYFNDDEKFTDEPRFNNGFDINPEGTKMAVPVMYPNSSPKIIEYNFATKRVDTLPVNIDGKARIDGPIQLYRECLWLRYNPSGNKMLYSNYCANSLFPYPDDSSKIGIIDMQSYEKKELYAGVDRVAAFGSVSLFPEWSPNGENILYTTSLLLSDPPGRSSGFELYILRNVNDQ